MSVNRDEGQGDPTKISSSVSRWAATAWVAGIPAAAAAFRIFILAHGDVQVFLAIVENLNLISFLLSTLQSILVAPTGAIVAPVLVVLYYVSRKDSAEVRVLPKKIVAFSSLKPIIVGLSVEILIGFAFVPWATFLGMVIISPLALLFMGKVLDTMMAGSLNYPERRVDCREILSKVQRQARVLLWSFVVWISVIIAFRSPVWLPVEVISVESERQLSGGYVLRVDDTSLLLLYKDGGLRQIPTGDVEGRYICPQASAALSGLHDPMPSVLQVMLGRKNGYVPDPCDRRGIRWH